MSTPALFMSARRGFVSHEPVDHTAILRFLSARFGLPALTGRDANSSALMDLFDFAHPDFTVPMLPEAAVDPAKDAECQMEFP